MNEPVRRVVAQVERNKAGDMIAVIVHCSNPTCAASMRVEGDPPDVRAALAAGRWTMADDGTGKRAPYCQRCLA